MTQSLSPAEEIVWFWSFMSLTVSPTVITFAVARVPSYSKASAGVACAVAAESATRARVRTSSLVSRDIVPPSMKFADLSSLFLPTAFVPRPSSRR